MPARIATESTEYVRVPITPSNGTVNPTADVVELAIIPDGQNEPLDADWRTGDWETDSTQVPSVYYARVLIGPALNPPVVLSDGGWQVWVRIHDNPEVVVRQAGRLIVY